MMLHFNTKRSDECKFVCFFFFFGGGFVLVGLGFEFRALRLQNRHSTA
jgi:hypothetical protein